MPGMAKAEVDGYSADTSRDRTTAAGRKTTYNANHTIVKLLYNVVTIDYNIVVVVTIVNSGLQ